MAKCGFAFHSLAAAGGAGIPACVFAHWGGLRLPLCHVSVEFGGKCTAFFRTAKTFLSILFAHILIM